MIVSYKSGVLDKLYVWYNRYYGLVQKKISPQTLDFSHLFQAIYNILANIVNDLKLAKLLTYYMLGLGSILPLLIHPDVDEIYIDGTTGKVLVDIFPLGRFHTNIILTPVDIEKIILLSKIQAGTIVSVKNPSLKTSFETEDFLIRISIDFPPLVKAPQIDIRKIKKISYKSFIYNRQDLIKLSVIFAFLALRKNILIIGEPGSGKTTLASILLHNAPSYWRIVTIEDVRELNVSGHNFLRIKIKPLESLVRYSKEKEILKLLHRSPDYVFIGELQSYSDFKAFFHALSAGIKCLATSHSDSIKNFKIRLLNTFQFRDSQIKMIDLIVLMKRKITDKKIERRINKLYLLNADGDYEQLKLNELEKLIPPKTVRAINNVLSVLETSPSSIRNVIEKINKEYY